MTGVQAYHLWLRWCRRYGPSIFATHAVWGAQCATSPEHPVALRLLIKAGERPMRVLEHICKTRLYPNGQARRSIYGWVGNLPYGKSYTLKLVSGGRHLYVNDRQKIDRIFDLYEAFVLVGGLTERLSVLEVAHDDLCVDERQRAFELERRKQQKERNRAARLAETGDAA